VNGARNLKVEVAPNKQSLTVSGEWAIDPRASNKSAGGSDVIVPVKMIEERARALSPSVTLVTGPLVGGKAELPLPATPNDAAITREFQIEIRAMTGGRNATVAQGNGTVKLPWSGTDARGVRYHATLQGDKVIVSAGR
jgi:hypothetical protein